jgi:hypothetical protein
MFVKEMLRTKMRKIINEYKDVELAFEAVRKATKIQTTTDFINEFLNKEYKYGQLLGSIEKAEERINVEKEQRA